VEPWPEFISGIEMEVRWESLPVTGTLRVRCSAVADFSLACERDDELMTLAVDTPSAEGMCTTELDEAQISALLVRRRVVVRWDRSPRQTPFPLNIASCSKAGLPAVLGQDPTEQDLLAYFHGRIDEEDLMNLLIERGRQKQTGHEAALTPLGRELQNYVVREFLEGIYGMEDNAARLDRFAADFRAGLARRVQSRAHGQRDPACFCRRTPHRHGDGFPIGRTRAPHRESHATKR
jgi:hypothetical protein